MNYIYELIALLLFSYIIASIITTISTIQFDNFLKHIGMSKYFTKEKLLLINREFDTKETELYDKYKTKILIYNTIFIFVSVLLLNLNYQIINF